MSEFMEMTATSRMRRIEAMRARIRRMMREDGHPPSREDKRLSLKTVAWLRRLETALVDETCTDKTYAEMDRAAVATVPAEEANEFRRRLRNFVVLRDEYPLDAASFDEALPAVLEGLLRIAESNERTAK